MMRLAIRWQLKGQELGIAMLHEAKSTISRSGMACQTVGAGRGRALPGVRAKVREHMALRGLPCEKVLATVVHLLETTLIRVGNRPTFKSIEEHPFHYGTVGSLISECGGSNPAAPTSQSGLYRPTRESLSKPRGTAAFRGYVR
jgi:hypothetical protein